MRVAMRTAVAMLSSGAQSDEVEAIAVAVASAFGLHGVQAAVTFSTITLSHDASDLESPTTLLHIVRDRTSDFARLAAAASLARGVRDGDGRRSREPRPRSTRSRSSRCPTARSSRSSPRGCRPRPRRSSSAAISSMRPMTMLIALIVQPGARRARSLDAPAVLPRGVRGRGVGPAGRGDREARRADHRRPRPDRQPAAVPARVRAGLRLPGPHRPVDDLRVRPARRSPPAGRGGRRRDAHGARRGDAVRRLPRRSRPSDGPTGAMSWPGSPRSWRSARSRSGSASPGVVGAGGGARRRGLAGLHRRRRARPAGAVAGDARGRHHHRGGRTPARPPLQGAGRAVGRAGDPAAAAGSPAGPGDARPDRRGTGRRGCSAAAGAAFLVGTGVASGDILVQAVRSRSATTSSCRRSTP